jgi:hypothetical protein
LTIFYLNAANRDGRTRLFFDTEFDLQRLTALDGEQLKAASLVAECRHRIDGLFGVQRMDICLDLCRICTIECV